MLIHFVADTTTVVHTLDIGDDDDLDIVTVVSVSDIMIYLGCRVRVGIVWHHITYRDQARYALIELLSDQPVMPVMPRLPAPDE